jgi:hypothetical protein
MNTLAPSKHFAARGLLTRAACVSLMVFLGCAESGSSPSGSGGSNGSGGNGNASGGSNGSGGNRNASGGSNGSGGNGNASGGSNGSGGSATGGNLGSGGSASGGNLGSGGSATGGSGSGGAIIGGTGGGSGGAGGSGTGGAAGSGGHAGAGGSGGGSGAAGTSGTAGSGGAGGASASHCAARPGMVFCDDFEADSPGAPPSPWTVTATTSTEVSVDGTNPASSGTKSIHVLTTSNDYDTFLALHDTSVLPVSGGQLYLRFYIRLATGTTAGHNTLVRGDLYASQGMGNNLLFGEDNYMIMESINGDGEAAMSNNSYYSDGMMIGVNYPMGVWTCVELLLDHNAPAIDVWVNGTEVPDLHQTAWKIDAYDYLRFGFEKYAGPASEIWYDDIAFGTMPIGCN